MRKISIWFGGQQGEWVSFRFGELVEPLRVRALIVRAGTRRIAKDLAENASVVISY
jgi:hypothetical protein